MRPVSALDDLALKLGSAVIERIDQAVRGQESIEEVALIDAIGGQAVLLEVVRVLQDEAARERFAAAPTKP